MAKNQRALAVASQMGAGQFSRTGIMVAFDPDPFSARAHLREGSFEWIGQGNFCQSIVKAVAKADHGAGGGAFQIAGKASQSFQRLIGW